MNESFLHYVWQFQYFNKLNLRTTEDEDVQVIKPGILNTDAGPDFSQAKIKIGAMEWAGAVEIHIKASEWNDHKHHQDKAYDNVVLHVVWQNDKPVVRHDQSLIPTVELRGRVEEALLLQYRKLVNSSFTIPCSKSMSSVPEVIKLSMLDKSVLHRMEKKAQEILNLLKQNVGDWEETAYQTIAKNFGFKVNSESFLHLARVLPFKIIRKHLSHPFQVEALLFGHAGFLEREFKDDYYERLKREYQILSVKYQLADSQLKPSEWRFLRLRPANFPTLRLAQFADLLLKQPNLFSAIRNAENYISVLRLFQIDQSDYWKKHYRFGMPAKSDVPTMGETSHDTLIINSVVPLLVAYAKQHDDQMLMDRAMNILQSISSEKNKILNAWSDLGWNVKNAFDSQGLIELYNSFCTPRQCLNCSIGTFLLKPRT
jgi:Protein of unknown function (DUF2851)